MFRMIICATFQKATEFQFPFCLKFRLQCSQNFLKVGVGVDIYYLQMVFSINETKMK